MTDRLLDGVRVLELAEDVAGPYGGKPLADLGAEVVKVESKDGDPTRARGPFPTGRVDRAQSSLAEPGAREAAERLCRWADLMLASKGSGAAERLGLSDGLPGELNPRLVRVSISPFGALGTSGPVVAVGGGEIEVAGWGEQRPRWIAPSSRSSLERSYRS